MLVENSNIDMYFLCLRNIWQMSRTWAGKVYASCGPEGLLDVLYFNRVGDYSWERLSALSYRSLAQNRINGRNKD